MPSKGARLLLVEDDEVICSLLARNLEARGHELSIAGDAQMALKLLSATRFDLVLLDINLPDQTGWDVLRTARKERWLSPSISRESAGEEEPCFPVVVLSAVRVNKCRLAEFRPLAYLPKPFPMEALLQLVAEVARQRKDEHAQEPVLSEEERSHA